MPLPQRLRDHSQTWAARMGPFAQGDHDSLRGVSSPPEDGRDRPLSGAHTGQKRCCRRDTAGAGRPRAALKASPRSPPASGATGTSRRGESVVTLRIMTSNKVLSLSEPSPVVSPKTSLSFTSSESDLYLLSSLLNSALASNICTPHV